MITKSHKITIFRKIWNTKRGDGDDPSFYRMKIGGSLNGVNCLTEEEKIKLLPPIIHTSPNDPINWNRAVNTYFSNIHKEVPITGLSLEIGMIYNNEEDAKKEVNGTPINPADYILYRYCLGYSRVANTPEDVYKSPNIMFYITDPITESKKAANRVMRENYAKTLYFELLKDAVQIDNVVAMYDHNPDILNTDDKIVLLAGLSNPREPQLDPNNVEIEKFISYVTDKKLQSKAFVKRCLSYAILRKIENTEMYYFGDTKIGNGLEEAVEFVLNTKNDSVYEAMKAKLKLAQSGVKTINDVAANMPVVGTAKENVNSPVVEETAKVFVKK